jgi:APA family basic amino acid/polyamine antiporter
LIYTLAYLKYTAREKIIQSTQNKSTAGSTNLLGFWGLLSISIGQVVGAGVVVLTGIGISITGYGVPWAFLLALGIIFLPTLCIAALGAAIPATGGMYTYVRDLLGNKTGFIYLMLLVAGQVMLATYALGFSEYVAELLPGINTTMVAVAVMVVCYVANLLGLQTAARMQVFIVLLLISSLLAFVVYGLIRVDDFSNYTEPAKVMPAGIGAFISAAYILRLGLVGGEFVSELGGESQNPSRNIPLVMLTCLLFVTVLYIGVGVVATGVLPLSAVEGKSLAFIAKEIFPPALYLVFVIGGILLALMSTLNAIFAWCTKGLYRASHDGWFSQRLAVTNRYGVPYLLLTGFFIVGLVPILVGTTLAYITILGNAVGIVFGIIPALALYNLNTKNPDAYAKATFKLPVPAMKILPLIALAIYVYGAYLSFSGFLKLNHVIAFFVYAALAMGYAIWREPHVVKVRSANNQQKNI